MPGSAVMDPTVLVDDLFSSLIDDLRDELHSSFGVRHFDMFTVLRTHAGTRLGRGRSSSVTEVETEITPQPLVLPYVPKLNKNLEPCGIDEAGSIILQEISLTYTEAELTGPTLAPNQEWIIRLKDAHGQLMRDRDYVIDAVPYPERAISENGPGWIMQIKRVGA